MCGIAGFFHPAETPDRYPDLMARMLTLLTHRGPDEAGYYVSDCAGLGTARLSVIDRQSGTQPMSSSDGRYWICCNGELYNFRELRRELEDLGCYFHTASDTEVVLQAWMQWGEVSLRRLNGAFAFAIHDSGDGSIVLARDRFGERPLFYTLRDGQLLFASEMKAFLAFDRVRFAFDSAQLATIFTTWTPLPHQTGFAGIEQLPMGEILMVDRNGRSRRIAYAPLDLQVDVAVATEEEAVERIRETLRQSIALRMRSDVEVGVYLSGGLDSSIVAVLTTDATGGPVRTFSVEFEEAQFDESVEQQEVVERLDTTHTAVRVSNRDIADHFPRAIFHAEVPAFRTAFVPMFLLSQAARDKGVKVVLTGEGADEAFLGYGIFKDTLLLTSWNTLTTDEKKAKLARLYPYLGHFSGDEQHGRLMGLYQQFSADRTPYLFSHEMRLQNGRFSTRLLREPIDPLLDVVQWLGAEPGFDALTPVQKAQWLEFKTLLSGYLLSTQGDRMALAHGVENRCPYLDPAVVALAASVNLRFDDGFDEKRLLKKAFCNRLPPAVLAKGKFPYRAPDIAAFAQCRDDTLDLLSDRTLSQIDCLDPVFVRAFVKKVFSTSPEQISTRENQTFTFLMSLVWLHHYFVRREGTLALAGRSLERMFVKVVDERTGQVPRGVIHS